MQNFKFVKTLKYADFMFHFSSLWPFILWIWFGSKLTTHLVSSTSKTGYRISKTIAFPIWFLHTMVFLLWLIPIIIGLRSIYYTTFVTNTTDKFKFQPTNPSLPPGFGYCMTTKVKKEDAAKGVVSYWDYDCEDKNSTLIGSGMLSILNRFYYINYAIFLIVLLIYNAVVKVNVLNNKFVLLNIKVALLLGVIGCILPIFAPGFYLRSLWVIETWAFILSMNAVCLMLIGLSIMSYSKLV